MTDSISSANAELLGAQQAIDAAGAALPTATPADVVSMQNAINQLEGTMNEVKSLLAQLDALLQMMMDRRSKLMEMVQNILRETSKTGDKIIENLK
jgi:hypothetical protein